MDRQQFLARFDENVPMIATDLTHFLLFTEVHMKWIDGEEAGTWRFQLQSLTNDDQFSASGAEHFVSRDRIALLAVVRGLEALDQASHVTLLTSSRYVRRGFRQGLEQWTQNDWHWERFGRRVLVKNHDLWRRVENALQFHQLNCRLWRIDPAETESRGSAVPAPHFRRNRRTVVPVYPESEEHMSEPMQLAAG